VASLRELIESKKLSAMIDGSKVALFLVDGEVVATTGICPHAGGPLFRGSLCGTTVSCPWHGWSFDLTTGACAEDPEVFLPLYKVQIEGDDISIEFRA
jgi:nitrite reductase (NADH) small subunit